MTIPLAKVLSAMLDAADHDRYGLDLMKTTGMSSGTLYPILQRLEQAGWVETRWEDVDPVAEARPARKYYRLTAHGATAARTAIAELHAATAPRHSSASAKASPAW